LVDCTPVSIRDMICKSDKDKKEKVRFACH
jgi:hypothetical protein